MAGFDFGSIAGIASKLGGGGGGGNQQLRLSSSPLQNTTLQGIGGIASKLSQSVNPQQSQAPSFEELQMMSKEQLIQLILGGQ